MKTENIEFEMRESIRVAAGEIVADYPDAVDVDDVHEIIWETADGLVNVYTYPCVQEWVAAGMPDFDDFFMDANPGDSITEQIQRVMFLWYESKLHAAVAEMIAERNEMEN